MLFRHFIRWSAVLVGIPLLALVAFAVIGIVLPPIALLGLLVPFYFFLPPALISFAFDRPYFGGSEVGIFPESWVGFVLTLMFWTGLCLLLAAITVAVKRRQNPPPASSTEQQGKP